MFNDLAEKHKQWDQIFILINLMRTFLLHVCVRICVSQKTYALIYHHRGTYTNKWESCIPSNTHTQQWIYKCVHKSRLRHRHLFNGLPLARSFACKPHCDDQLIWPTVYVRYFHQLAIYVRWRRLVINLLQNSPNETKQSDSSETKWWKLQQPKIEFSVITAELLYV